jgi:ubiquinone/menaquinone biosynthesis C-methylase UbiE
MTKTLTCPWWLLFTFDNPLRKLIHDPHQILKNYVHAGDTVLDGGCGMGYFTLELARLVRLDGAGTNQGCVIAADLQPRMLAGLCQRAGRAGLLDRIRTLNSQPDQIGLDCPLDFALAFWMVHEVRQPEGFLREIHSTLKPGGGLLIVEPVIHVTGRAFDRTVHLSESLGFIIEERPSVRFSRAVLLRKERRTA